MFKKILFSITLFSGMLFANNINGAGASFPANVYNSWIASYAKDTKLKVNYQSIGSGGGIKQIKVGTVDFGASDEPISIEDLKSSKLIQFPTLVGAIVVA